MVPNFAKVILDIYNKFTLCYNLMHINFIGFLSFVSQQIIFYTVSMIKNQKLKNIEEGIKQTKKLYLQRGLKMTCIHIDS